jgi:hypothetical protein
MSTIPMTTKRSFGKWSLEPGAQHMVESIWNINEMGYFEADGLAVLVFHNNYPEGKQGGVEIIQHGERVATNGDLRLEPAPGQWAALPEVRQRRVDAAHGTIYVQLAFPGLDRRGGFPAGGRSGTPAATGMGR